MSSQIQTCSLCEKQLCRRMSIGRKKCPHSNVLGCGKLPGSVNCTLNNKSGCPGKRVGFCVSKFIKGEISLKTARRR